MRWNALLSVNSRLATDNLTVFDQIGHSLSRAGRITSAQTSSRQVQFALKVIWWNVHACMWRCKINTRWCTRAEGSANEQPDRAHSSPSSIRPQKDRSAPQLCARNKLSPKPLAKMLGLDDLAKKKT